VPEIEYFTKFTGTEGLYIESQKTPETIQSMPYIAHVPGTPWMNPFNGLMFNSEQAYLNGMSSESSQDMDNWRNFQRLHGLTVAPFGERPGCVLAGLTGQARIDKSASLGAIQFPIVRPSRSAKIYKRSPMKFKKDKITSNCVGPAKNAGELLGNAI